MKTNRIKQVLIIGVAPYCVVVPSMLCAVSDHNNYVMVESNTPGVESIVAVDDDFYVTTRNVGSPPFQAEILVTAMGSHRLIEPNPRKLHLAIGESATYRIDDGAGTEDGPNGRIEVLKLDIQQFNVNTSIYSSRFSINLTDDSYPGGDVVWTSTSQYISGKGRSISFDPSQVGSGLYIITATATVVRDYQDSCLVRVYEIKTSTHARTPKVPSRTTLGVGEEVDALVFPVNGQTVWSVSGGARLSPRRGPKTTFTAPSEAGSFTLSCDVEGLNISLSFNAIEPTGVARAVFLEEDDVDSRDSGAKMHLWPVVMAPTHVSFYNVKCMEVGADAKDATGYWLDHAPPAHDTATGANVWFPLDESNQWPESMDHVGLGPVDPPYNPGGTFKWPIPAKWTVNGSNVEHDLTGWEQGFELKPDGTVTVRKFGHWLMRAVGGASSNGTYAWEGIK